MATATAVEAMAEIEVDLPEQYAYEVLIFEQDSPRWPVALGQPLPTFHLWLTPDLAMPVELDASYEETCRTLRMEE